MLSKYLIVFTVSGRSLDDSFTRTASFRKSNRARALSSLILSKSSNMKNAMFRSTWTGSADNIEDYRSRSPSRTPPNASPSLSRRQSVSKILNSIVVQIYLYR